MSSALEGKIALVTGGSRGIGAAIAKQLARDGANVAITYTSAKDKADEVVKEMEAIGRRAIAIRADNLAAEAMDLAVNETIAKLGGLDILVNNAGILHTGPIEDFTLEDFEQTIAINVRAPFLACRAAGRQMQAGGRIISIGSNLADRAPRPGLSLYSMSKAALVGMSKALARELGQKGITVNVVQPGSTDTEMNPADGAFADNQRARMALPGRFATPEDVAGLVAWLAGPGAASVTGSVYTIDRGSNA
ncbi:3-oxoacyl-ACP reductase family protein [Mesorhizobium sp. M2A.F.Ca.ET.039.01.1.1]|uniref:SDR family NAD(P)-dependent oxidoreductase n=1 Tax=Mesorhizobium sp. M2A.F.Ca.ET.039.01.1.1 TaxID=2496746 RepID=UPI000FCAF96A|nr:3-oxoacyl-ACP reductase family protein [Mesorhizobium sp. M2A.F.Ca.ET.039.01.1.1]RWX72334.1 SDR family oxidoreductase [Mesorhizobium sp. M2A.F.Ca.ET.039.01.1.1]